MNPESNSIRSIKHPTQLNKTSELLDLLRDTLTSVESSASDLHSTISPILLDQKLGEVGEDTTRNAQSELNRQLTDVLLRLQSLNVFLIDTKGSVTL